MTVISGCPQPTVPQYGNGSPQLTSNPVNTEITFSCDAGYTLYGSTTLKCQSNYQWNGTPPICQGKIIRFMGISSIILWFEFFWGNSIYHKQTDRLINVHTSVLLVNVHMGLLCKLFIRIQICQKKKPNSLFYYTKIKYINIIISSGGSRISNWGVNPAGGCRCPTWLLFGENVCENERIGSCWGGDWEGTPLDPPLIRMYFYRPCMWEGNVFILSVCLCVCVSVCLFRL